MGYGLNQLIAALDQKLYPLCHGVEACHEFVGCTVVIVNADAQIAHRESLVRPLHFEDPSAQTERHRPSHNWQQNNRKKQSNGNNATWAHGVDRTRRQGAAPILEHDKVPRMARRLTVSNSLARGTRSSDATLQFSEGDKRKVDSDVLLESTQATGSAWFRSLLQELVRKKHPITSNFILGPRLAASVKNQNHKSDRPAYKYAEDNQS